MGDLQTALSAKAVEDVEVRVLRVAAQKGFFVPGAGLLGNDSWLLHEGAESRQCLQQLLSARTRRQFVQPGPVEGRAGPELVGVEGDQPVAGVDHGFGESFFGFQGQDFPLDRLHWQPGKPRIVTAAVAFAEDDVFCPVLPPADQLVVDMQLLVVEAALQIAAVGDEVLFQAIQ